MVTPLMVPGPLPWFAMTTVAVEVPEVSVAGNGKVPPLERVVILLLGGVR